VSRGAARAALAVAIGLAALALRPPSATPSGVVPAEVPGPAALLFGRPIDANAADRATLEALPGVGPGRAAAWIEERSKRPFCGPADLERVKGIGPKTRAGLAGLLSFPPRKSCGAIPDRPIDL
jgi:DNA uptake protein ComE-like DNA-binding protein